MLRFIKAVLIIFGLLVASLILSAFSPQAGFYVGLALLIVPGVAVFKPLPKYGLGHRGFSLSVALLVGLFVTALNASMIETADREALAALKISDPDAYLEELEASDRTVWLEEMAEIDPERHVVALEEERVRIAAEEARRAEEEAERAAQKAIKDAKQAEIVRIAEEKEAARKAETRASDITNYLEMMEREIPDLQGFKISEYTATIDDITKGLLLFGVWTMLYEEGEAYANDPAVKAKRDAFRSKLISTQQRGMPVLRDAYGPVMRKLLWEADGSARTIGQGYRTVEFVSPAFVRNINIKDTHEEIRDQLFMLRFNRAQYKWFKHESEYSYYDMKAPSDKDLVIWEKGGRYRTVQ